MLEPRVLHVVMGGPVHWLHYFSRWPITSMGQFAQKRGSIIMIHPSSFKGVTALAGNCATYILSCKSAPGLPLFQHINANVLNLPQTFKLT